MTGTTTTTFLTNHPNTSIHLCLIILPETADEVPILGSPQHTVVRDDVTATGEEKYHPSDYSFVDYNPYCLSGCE